MKRFNEWYERTSNIWRFNEKARELMYLADKLGVTLEIQFLDLPMMPNLTEQELYRLREVAGMEPQGWFQKQAKRGELYRFSEEEDIEKLKEQGYECRIAPYYSVDEEDATYVIVRCDSPEIAVIWKDEKAYSVPRGVEIKGCGSTEEEAWSEAL